MKSILVLLPVLFALGCSDNGKDGDGKPSDPSTKPEAISTALGQNLIGTWLTPCYPDKGNFFQQQIQFQENGTGTSQDSIYADSKCLKSAVSQEPAKSFTFSIISEVSAYSGEIRIQSSPESLKEFKTNLEGDQALLSADGITLRLTRKQ